MLYNKGQVIGYAIDKWNIELTAKTQGGDRILARIERDGNIQVDISLTGGRVDAAVSFRSSSEPVRLSSGTAYDGEIRLLLCNTQNRTALYINGELCDEDWPLGAVPLEGATVAEGSCEVHSDFSYDNAYLSTGHLTMNTSPESFRPLGHNTGAGDCMPFSHEGTYHLFYLFDRRGHRSKWGLGAHQWAHISTRDFKSWTEHPMAVEIDEQYEGSICTGSVAFFKGIYYAFYAIRMSDGSPARLTWSVSEDCVHFKKSGCFFELDECYDRPSARDPKVIVDGEGVGHMFVTTSLSVDGESRGCLAHLTSSDFVTWTPVPPVLVLDIQNQPECPDYFFYKGRYYLIYSPDGVARYLYSDEPFGPWSAPLDNKIPPDTCRVPKTAFFGRDRIIAAGFETDSPDRGYGGRVVFIELMGRDDGGFDFSTPAEMSGVAE